MRHRYVVGILLALCITGARADGTWPGFRGPSHDGAVRDARLFEGSELALSVGWKVDLGSGYSALAVDAERVYAMFAEGEGDFLGAFDVGSGEREW